MSVPPLFAAARLEALPRKGPALAALTVGQGALFLALAAAAPSLIASGWAAPVFLLVYTVFYALTGLSVITQGTLMGKLVPATRRGRLLAVSTLGGALPACALAAWWLPGWLEAGDWASIFAAVGGFFVLSSAAVYALREPADAPAPRPRAGAVGEALALLRADRPFRRLVFTGALLTCTLLLFPHYQALARERLGLAGADLVGWVIVQTLSMGAGTLLGGPLADRFGNRLALRAMAFIAAAIPLAALGLTRLDPALGRALFPLLFAGVGLTPVGLRLMIHYTLELAPPDRHPTYLACAQVCWAAVLVLSPLAGWAIDAAGFDAVFLAVAATVFAGAVSTFWLQEPRGRQRQSPSGHTVS